MGRIVVISDTHWDDPLEFEERLEGICCGASLIIHAGDAVRPFVHERLSAWAPYKAVSGNCDGGQIRAKYPELDSFEIEGISIGLLHGHRADLTNPLNIASFFSNKPQIYIHGHSHVAIHYTHEINGETKHFLNPGSFSEPRDRRAPSWAEIDCSQGIFVIQHLFKTW
jgi:putative phosphoesterase